MEAVIDMKLDRITYENTKPFNYSDIKILVIT